MWRTRRRGEGGREREGVRDGTLLFPLPCPFPSSPALHRIAMHLLLFTYPFSIALHTVLSVQLNYVAFPLPSLPFPLPYHPSFLDSLPSLFMISLSTAFVCLSVCLSPFLYNLYILISSSFCPFNSLSALLCAHTQQLISALAR